MEGFFALLFVASLGGFVANMARPSLFAKTLLKTRKTGAAFFGGLAFISLILTGASTPQTTVKGISTTATPTIQISVTLAPTKTPTPTLVPTAIPTAKPVYIPPTTQQYPTTPPATTQNSGLSNDNYYTNVDGNQVHSPAYSNSVPAGASAICGDGTYSFSQHRSGTCSHHDGVSSWL